MKIHVTSETGRLREVVLGRPESNGPVPTPEQTFDAKSYESASRASTRATKTSSARWALSKRCSENMES